MARYKEHKGGFQRGRLVKLAKGVYTDSREYWMEETSGVNGKDMTDLYGLLSGCQRKLWYRKTGATPNAPIKLNLTERYQKTVKDLYYTQTKRYANMPNRDFRSKEHKNMYCGYDIRLPADKAKIGVKTIPGIIKVMPEPEYLKYKWTGLTGEISLEAQHIMYVTRSPWMVVLIFCPFISAILSYDIATDKAMIDNIITEVQEFWPHVTENNPPPKLEVNNPKCFECNWRITCQGEEFMVPFDQNTLNLEKPVNDLLLLQFYQDTLTLTKAIIEKEVVRGLLGKEKVITPLATVEYVTKTQRKIDTAKILQDNPDFKQNYGVPITTRELKIIPWNVSCK